MNEKLKWMLTGAGITGIVSLAVALTGLYFQEKWDAEREVAAAVPALTVESSVMRGGILEVWLRNPSSRPVIVRSLRYEFGSVPFAFTETQKPAIYDQRNDEVHTERIVVEAPTAPDGVTKNKEYVFSIDPLHVCRVLVYFTPVPDFDGSLSVAAAYGDASAEKELFLAFIHLKNK